MELKPYQQQVINDLALFLEHVQEFKNTRDAYNDFWIQHPRTPLQPFPGAAIEPYKNNVPRVPHVCLKVPTAGGKTFIACNAMRTIFDAFNYDKPKAVVWLVPSITILEQTIKNLKNPSHPYRQKINALFGNKVEVFDKAELLQGNGFNATSIFEQLNIMIFSFDSLRAKNKDDRKIFQENGNLQSFESVLGKDVDITLGAVIDYLNPVVIVDESHNAESDLSIDMLKVINPCFILDLTATPRKNSNIISFIDALELKRENMVKLPVVVYNHHDKTEVVNSSLQLQKHLEEKAKEEEKNGGKYIRPIVLFQVQPKNGKDFASEIEEKSNVQKLKETLLELKIPEEQIKIKTANINEIKGIDLMSKECEVRYIITINALKEGWDCPFAYILASLADKNSAIDVEQILGRVLRQPYVLKHNSSLLNMSYVLTASAKFMETLDNIVKGLNRAGFSERDCKLASNSETLEAPKAPETIQLPLGTRESEDEYVGVAETRTQNPEDKYGDSDEIDTSRINLPTENTAIPEAIATIEQAAIEQDKEFQKKVLKIRSDNTDILPAAIQTLVKSYSIKEVFAEQAKQLQLPQFFLKIPKNDLFGIEEAEILLEKENLLKDFSLSKADTNIAFENVESELYQVDLDESKKEHTPTFLQIDGAAKDMILEFILDPSQKNSRVKNFTSRIMGKLGNIYPISDKELEKYICRILEDFSDEQFNTFANKEYTYKDQIKAKINSLADEYAEKKFRDLLDTDKVFIKPSYIFPNINTPGNTCKNITKSLYEKEGNMNDFEEAVINSIANMPNIAFWTRNTERQGFCINGFIKHYPDFIIQTKSGKTLVVETKGDHLDGSKSLQKIKLGEKWEGRAGGNFKYFMVFKEQSVEGAYKLDEFLNIVKDI